MNIDLIRQTLLLEPWDESITLLDDNDTVFWVDWREEDDAIPRYCESILKTGELVSELKEVDTDGGVELYIVYRGKSTPVPLTFSEKDRHITLVALNNALEGDYELRFCIASSGCDSCAFLPLSISQWQALEEEFGDAVSRHFYRFSETPNLFTDEQPFSPPVSKPSSSVSKPWWKFW